MRDHEFYHIIEKQLSGDINSEDRSRFEAWLAHSSENRELFERMELYWEYSGHLNVGFEIGTGNALSTLKDKIHGPGQTRWNSRVFRIVGIMVLIIVMGLIFIRINQHNKPVYVNTMNEIKSFKLSLGTISLKENSEIGYPATLDEKEKNRTIQLSGEAYFEINNTNSRPVIIKTENTIAEVIEATFQIRSFPQEGITKIMVLSGQVDFYKISDPSNRLILESGEDALYDKERNILLSPSNL